MNNCRWVLADRSYCEKPVNYHMFYDDDDTRRRRYYPFCPEHMIKALALLARAAEQEEPEE